MAINVRLILASQSIARQAMLQKVGLEFEAIPADIDEDKIIDDMKDKSAEEMAIILAKQKALFVAENHPDALVIGGDTIIELDDEIVTKVADVNKAREKLKMLRGNTHSLTSGVCVVRGKEILWSHAEEARLTMHDFDDDFLEDYCANAGDALTKCVGAYQIESHGPWLFDQIKGDYFTILGMPLLPLLNYLRNEYGAGP